jgi:hypothetical protein
MKKINSTPADEKAIKLNERPPIMTVTEVDGVRHLRVCDSNGVMDDDVYDLLKNPPSLFPK